MKILANDGISSKGKAVLEGNGFEVVTTHVAQNQLANFINNEQIDAILVRSATQVRQELIEACPSLKLIGRGGVGMDNIDVEFAIDQGLHVVNTPEASSKSVAELVFAHLFGMVRFLHQANRDMPLEGDSRFNELKKAFSKGIEISGKTLGIIGFGKIGQEVAKKAIGLGMHVLATDTEIKKETLQLEFFDQQTVEFEITCVSLEEVLQNADFITLHVPAQQEYIIGKKEFDLLKSGAFIINTSRGDALDEVALIDALESGKIAQAALDVFEKEPHPEIQLLMHPNISLSPHIGAATLEAQDRIGIELANQIVRLLK